MAERSKEFRDVLNKVYDGVKKGTKEGIGAKNARLRSPNPGWDHSDETKNIFLINITLHQNLKISLRRNIKNQKSNHLESFIINKI